MNFVESSEITQYEGMPVAVVRFSQRLEVLSSALLNGGSSHASAMYILQVSKGYDDDTPELTAAKVRDALGLPEDTIGMMTAAEVEHVFNIQTVTFNGSKVMAIATAGLANHVVAGDELLNWDERAEISSSRSAALSGTINIAVVSPVPLTDAAKVNLFIPLTEAKTAALNDRGFRETGTSSDSMAVLCPEGTERIVYTGTASDIGIAAARAVRNAVGYALNARNEHPVPERLYHKLDSIGAKDDIVDFIKDLFASREDAEEYFRSYLDDPRNRYVADIALHMSARCDSIAEDGNPEMNEVVRSAFAGMTGQDPGFAEGVIDSYVISVVKDIRSIRG